MSSPKSEASPRPKRGAGFSLVELLVVLALAGVIIGMGLPAMMNALLRAKLTGFAQQACAAMQGARLEAIKRSSQARVEVHFADNSVIAWVPVNNDTVYTPGTDVLVMKVSAPSGVVLQGPGPVSTANVAAVSGFDLISGGGVAYFNSDGSVAKLGGFRFRDKRDNIMEAFVSPVASARIAVRKYAGDPNGSDDLLKYHEADEQPGWTWN
jgi:prepilin-type N-terminal cleavage/methylation domain-containing protein